MNTTIGLVLVSAMLVSCETQTQSESVKQSPMSITGTWRLISGTTVEKGDTTITDYTKNWSFIKIINDTHFAFVKHDLNKGQGASADFSAGGGPYTLRDSVYTERLEYCNDREWEGNDFTFIITLKNDTLTQRGVEKVEKADVNRLNIEQYVRLKN